MASDAGSKKTTCCESGKKTLNHVLFWTPFSLISLSLCIGVVFPEVFICIVNAGKQTIIDNFSWLISITGLLCVIGIATAYFSRFGSVVIGGKGCKPLLNQWQWFSITLCTTIAINILFWPVIEPLHDLMAPPVALGLTPQSPNAAVFAMSAMYMNWGLIPYAINALPALVFAVCYYNLRCEFSISTILYPLINKKAYGTVGKVIDILSLYALALGMATSLGTCAILLARGISRLLPFSCNIQILWGVIIVVILTLCIVTSVSGLMHGIRIVSEYNTRLFFALMLFVFITGPTVFILDLTTEALGLFLGDFFQRALFVDPFRTDSWAQQWTVFSFANYMVWAPVAALFLGRISRGYTVRQFILTNVILPTAFVFLYTSIFSGTTLWQEMLGDVGLHAFLGNNVDEAVYVLFENLPFSVVVIPIFLLIVVISFTTAANSTTSAMAFLTTKNLSTETLEAPAHIKVAWSLVIGVMAFMMLLFSGIEGMKTLTYLGGAPITLVILGSVFSLFKLIQTKNKLNIVRG